MALAAGIIKAYSGPGPKGYGRVLHFSRGQRVVSATLSNLAFNTEALPPEG